MSEIDPLAWLAYIRMSKTVERDFPDVMNDPDGQRLVGEYDAKLREEHPEMDPEECLRKAFRKAQRKIQPESHYSKDIAELAGHRSVIFHPKVVAQDDDDEEQREANEEYFAMRAKKGQELTEEVKQRRAYYAALQKKRSAMGG